MSSSSLPCPGAPQGGPLIPSFAVQWANHSTQEPAFISPTLREYVSAVKCELDGRQDQWDRFKKFTNPYEYIHTPVPGFKSSVCRLKPLSRSFYKMIELAHLFDIVREFDYPIKTYHLAEGPGGFAEAMHHLRHKKYPGDQYHAITLEDDADPAVPGWRKSGSLFGPTGKGVIAERGRDGRGDLLNPANLIHFPESLTGACALVTGDGGFDFSVDFNDQENAGALLVLAQAGFAVKAQKPGGTFILKIFDIFTRTTAETLYILSCLYSRMQIVKPNTSRQANSEKYVVCRGFRGDKDGAISKQIAHILVTARRHPGMRIKSLLGQPPPRYFIDKLEECNAMLGQQQIENISSTLAMMDNTRYDRLEIAKKNHVQKCLAWCQKHKLPFNRTHCPANIFSSQPQRDE